MRRNVDGEPRVAQPQRRHRNRVLRLRSRMGNVRSYAPWIWNQGRNLRPRITFELALNLSGISVKLRPTTLTIWLSSTFPLASVEIASTAICAEWKKCASHSELSTSVSTRCPRGTSRYDMLNFKSKMNEFFLA